MATNPSSAASARSQYHHFVPQFMLKQFARLYGHDETPKGARKANRRRKHDTHKPTKRIYPGDHVLDHVDLTPDSPIIAVSPVRRILGEQDMYWDSSKLGYEQEVEDKFSRLESEAAKVFRKIANEFKGKKSSVCLTRKERNVVRKFLWLLKYRGPTFRERYKHETKNGYDADDREQMVLYMEEKGFERPIDVWLQNLRVMMDLDMDNEGRWFTELPEKIYPMDARWMVLHCEFSYMAFCTPSRRDEEFILTDYSYHIHEGRSNEFTDPSTGSRQTTSWIAFHEFAPLSPRLMIVLRSSFMPSPEEDLNLNFKAARERYYSMLVKDVYGQNTTSILSGLPIAKAHNSYSVVTSSGAQLLPGEDGRRSKKDRFTFRFFRVDTEHVNKINGVFLDNASKCTSVVYASRESFKKTLKWYLTADPEEMGKIVTPSPTDPKRVCMEKLASVMRQLGTECEPRWKEVRGAGPREEELIRVMLETMMKMSCRIPGTPPGNECTDSMRIYRGLGGSKQRFERDRQQAALMWNLRIKIDLWSAGVDEAVRQRNRDYLIDMYLQLPRRRVWLYLKQWRATELASSEGMQGGTTGLSGKTLGDPEDVIARASDVISPDRLNHLMYTAVFNDLKLKRSADFRPWSRFSADDAGRKYVCNLRQFAFTLPGSIMDCGIPEIWNIAAHFLPRIIREVNSENSPFQDMVILNKEQKIELSTRMLVREARSAIPCGRLDSDEFDEFFTVFFTLVYPTPSM